MKNEKLDLTDFKNAIDTLGRALKEYAKDETNDFVRDSCIQRFEYCYSLSTKTIKRHLKMASLDPDEIVEMDFQDIIRLAYNKGILKSSWDEWWEYRDNRAATSHGYKEDKAIEIVGKLQPFYDEILYLYDALSSIYET